MSNDIYRVEVEKIDPAAVTLRLVIRDAESGNLPKGKPWALMLACEGAYETKAKLAGIKGAITRAQSTKEDVLLELADRYIDRVKLVEKKNYPIKDERRYNEENRCDDERTCAWGRYTIGFKDPSWSKGWKPGLTWDSASYEPVDAGAKVRGDRKTGGKLVGRNKRFVIISKLGGYRSVLVDHAFWIGAALGRALKPGVDYAVSGGEMYPAARGDLDKAAKLGIPVISTDAFLAIPKLDWNTALRVARTTKTPKPTY